MSVAAPHVTVAPAGRAAWSRAIALALAVAAFAAATAAVATRTMKDLEVPGRPDLERYGMRDFRDAVYYPARALLDGRNPYRPETYRSTYPVGSKFPLYVPETLAFHVPFAVLPQRAAEVAHFAVNLASTLLLVWLALRYCGRERDLLWFFGVAAATVASRPGHTNLFTGECTAYAIAGAYAALLFPERRLVAAAGLAVAWMKPTFGLPLGVFLLARGDRRNVAVGTAAAAALSIAVLVPLVRAEGGIAGFVDAMRANYAAQGATEAYQGAQILAIDAGAFFARLAGGTPGAMLAPLELATTCIVLVLGAVAVAHQARMGAARAPLTLALVCLGVLIAIHHESYDGLILVLPMTMLATGAWVFRGGTAALRWVLLALLLVPTVNYVATYRLIEALDIDGGTFLAVTSANGGATLAAFLLCAALALGTPARR